MPIVGSFVAVVLAVLWGGVAARAQDIPLGTTVDNIPCLSDPAQTYALYVPSSYSPDRPSSLLMAFHPGARGRAMVEKYAAAAEKYGYIVAGSNTSRNGPWSVSAAAIRAMPGDLGRRFSIDAKRVYLAGLSGGARVAMEVALGKNDIAGVIASSAGFPDSLPRASVPFAIFSTAGTEDFNYLEMRLLDRKLTSPHYLAVFEGGHMLPPDAVALEAIEWMELQAMKSGRRMRDEALVDGLLAKRREQVASATKPADTVRLLDALVSDFSGLRDVSAEAARSKDLLKQSDVKKAVARDRAADDTEQRMLRDVFDLEAGLRDDDRRTEVLFRLRDELSKLSRAANFPDDSPGRSQARRVLRSITAGAAERVQDREYLTLLEQYGMRGR